MKRVVNLPPTFIEDEGSWVGKYPGVITRSKSLTLVSLLQEYSSWSSKDMSRPSDWWWLASLAILMVSMDESTKSGIVASSLFLDGGVSYLIFFVIIN